jgi:hypothetical protein
MVKLLLRFFDAFSWLVRAFGVDYAQFRAILETKLTLDTRRPMMAGGRQHAAKQGNAFAGSLVFYAFMGLFISFSSQMAGSPLVGMTIFHAFAMTMLAMSLIADFSSVLLDTTDNLILQPRPVNGRTILAARIAHICVYLTLLTLSLSLAVLIAGTYRWGAMFPPVFLLTLACSVALIVCVVNLFYVAAIRFTSGERLRDIILQFQVVMSVGIFAGYQFLPRLMDMKAIKDLRIDDELWIYVFPPAWMAAPIDLLAGHVGAPQLILSGMALILPIFGLIAVTRVLGPRFSQALATLDAAPIPRKAAAKDAHSRPLAQTLASLFCRTPTGRAAFEFVWLLCSRDRQFKLRTYPSLAFVLLLPILWVTTGYHGLRAALADLPTTHKHLLALYGACAMLPSVLIQLRFSDNPQSAWIYTALPIRVPGEVLAAAIKALMVRFVLPAFILLAGGTLAIWGPAVWDDITLAACTTLLMCMAQALLMGRFFPFSQPFAVADASGRMSKSLLLILIPAGLGGLHYALTFSPPMVPLAIPVALILSLLMYRAYARTPWSAVEG